MVATHLGPVRLPAPIEVEPEEHRHLFCGSYDVCLDRAARENWASWTCVHCVRFQRLRRAHVQEPAGPALGRQQDAVPWSAREEMAGRTVSSSGGGTSSASAARPKDDEPGQKVSHTLEEESGLLHMRLEAPSVPALFIEAARAVAEVVRGRPVETSAERAEEVSIEAPGPARLLVAWIQELVRRSVRSHVRFEEVDIIYVSDRQLVASIRGVRIEQMRTRIKAPMYHDPFLVQRPGHLTAMPVLDV